MNINLIGYISFGLTLLAFLISILALRASMRALRLAAIRNLRLKAIKRLTALEIELTEVVDSMASMHESLKKLRSRIGMRNLRAKSNGADPDVPDSRTDPDGWKRAMRLKLHNSKRK